jgi:hypothetical protein
MMIHVNPFLACQLSMFMTMNLYEVITRFEVESNPRRCMNF